MPDTAEAEVAARGGATAYRTVKRGNRTFLVAIVPQAGPRGGHTVAMAGPADPAEPTHEAVPLKVTKTSVRRKIRKRRSTTEGT